MAFCVPCKSDACVSVIHLHPHWNYLFCFYIYSAFMYGRNKDLIVIFILVNVYFYFRDVTFPPIGRFPFFFFLLWAADWLICLFSSKIMSYLPSADQWSNVASKFSNIQSFSIHGINISIHLNLINFFIQWKRIWNNLYFW